MDILKLSFNIFFSILVFWYIYKKTKTKTKILLELVLAIPNLVFKSTFYCESLIIPFVVITGSSALLLNCYFSVSETLVYEVPDL